MIIPLTQGYEAIIDNEDAELVNQHKWCIQHYNKTKCTKVYAKCHAKGGTRLMHRFIMGEPKDVIIDHINGNGLDNRRSNLRLSTKQFNAANRPKDRVKKATSKYKGVSLSSGKWTAQIQVDGKSIYLGRFDTHKNAAKAYDTAALKYFGEHAWLNLIS